MGVLRDDLLVGDGPDEEWTIVYWTNACFFQNELETIFHTYVPGRSVDEEIWIYHIAVSDVPAPANAAMYTQIQVRRDSNQVQFGTFSLRIPFLIATSRCKMWAVAHRRIISPDPPSFLVPQLKLSAYDFGAGTGRHVELEYFDEARDEDMGIHLDSSAVTYIGSPYPKQDPLYNVNKPHFNGCISNFQIFKSYLSETQLDNLWADGAGFQPPQNFPGLYEQWCSTSPWTQRQIGALQNIPLEHVGPLWDQEFREIQDQDGNVIHGVN